MQKRWGRGVRWGGSGDGRPKTSNEPGMKLPADKDTARVSAPTFAPHQIPSPSVPTGTTSHFDYLSLVFDAKIIDEICVNSNTYAELYKICMNSNTYAELYKVKNPNSYNSLLKMA